MTTQPALPVADGIWRITTPLPFRPRAVHAYLLDAGNGGWVLVDGGAGTDDAWRALDAGVRGLTRWGGVRLHVVTHMHMDHVGLVERVRQACGAPLAMGALDAERMAHAHDHPDEEADYRAGLVRRHGAPEELVGSARRTTSVRADLALGEGVAGVDGAPGWSSVWTPGHTAGHTSLFRGADRVLIAGDAVLPRVTPTIGVNRQRADPVGDYLAALDRLARLRPALALCGHGDPIEDPSSRLTELEADTRAETARVRALLGPEPRTAWEVAARRYADRDLPPGPALQALRETLAHLEHLTASGSARREEGGDGLVRFAALPPSPGRSTFRLHS